MFQVIPNDGKGQSVVSGPVPGRYLGAIRVMAQATLHLGEGKGVTLPNWFLTLAAGTFMTVSITVIGVGITTWADVRDDTRAVADYKSRIEALERNSSDIAVVKSQVTDINGKLDWLMNQQAGRGK